MSTDLSSPTPADSNVIRLLDRPMARDCLRQLVGSYIVAGQLSESAAVDDAILNSRHGHGIPESVLISAISQIDLMLQPAPDEVILSALLKCHAKTMRRNLEPLDEDLMLESYTEDLCEFPADVVEGVLRDWPKSNKWFPAMAEIYPELVRGVSYRVRARDWLEAEKAYGSA